MAETNSKLSKSINSARARHLSIDAGLIRAYFADAIAVMDPGELEELLRRAQINPSSIDTRGARISFEKVSKVFNRVRLALADEDLGRFERPVAPGFFRLMMLAVINTDTLGQALAKITEYRNVATDALNHSLRVEGNQVICELTQQAGCKTVSPGALDFYLSGVVRILSWLGNNIIVPTVVRLSFGPPAYIDEYRYLYYGASVLFNQPGNSVSFVTKSLEAKRVQSEDSLQKYLRQAPRDLFFPRYQTGGAAESVRDIVRQNLLGMQRVPTLEVVAAALDHGPQTLRRRLQEEGSSFHDIKLQVRRDRAIYLLGEESVSIERIAEAVGYTESSNFVRAFKEWTGMTPRQFRKRAT
jgi:AraC-like DNA-binding protein